MVDDIDEGAYELNRLVSALSLQTPDPQAEHRFMALPLRFPDTLYGMPAVSSEQEPRLDLVETYDSLVQDWISGLPHDIPGRTRIMKEKLARKIAADLLLARLVRLPNVPPKKDTNPVEKQLDTEQDVMPNQDSSNQETVAGPHVSSSKPEGSAHQREQEGVAGPSGAVTGTAQPDNGPAPVFSGLSTFTHFEAPSTMRPNVATLLSHWQPGTDPSSYKWQGIAQVPEEEERASRATTPKHRLRKKRSQLSAAANALAQPPTVVVPTVRTWGSQPDGEPLPRLQLQSSQPTIAVEVPMTQVERGQFGGREGIKQSSKTKKKKKRAAGF